jgi:hypothetical protein
MFVKKDDKKTRTLAAGKENAVTIPHYKSSPHHQGNSGGKNDSMLRRKKLGVCMSLQSVLVIFGCPAGIPVIRRIGTVALKSMERLSIIIALAATSAGYLACMMVFDEVAFLSWIQSNWIQSNLLRRARLWRPSICDWAY